MLSKMEVLMEEKRIPSLLLNILFAQVDEMMGRRSLIMLLRQAGLGEYVDNVPPLNDTPSITVDQYSLLLANIYEIFGPRGARPIFLRGGRLGAAEIRRQRPAQFAVAGTALKLLPTATRMRIVLERLAEQGQDLYGTPHHLHEVEDAFFVEMPDCPYCAEISRRRAAEKQPVTRPVCHIPASVIDEMMEWVTGQKHLVEEVACIAMGEPACRFRVAK
jgi:predicted hydrocarbon binding protein